MNEPSVIEFDTAKAMYGPAALQFQKYKITCMTTRSQIKNTGSKQIVHLLFRIRMLFCMIKNAHFLSLQINTTNM
jgi:hypothetical protein